MEKNMNYINKAKSMIAVLAITFLALLILSPAQAGFAGAPESADAVYKAKCASCHSPDGSGSGPMGKKMELRDLRSAEVQKQSDAQLLGIISKGKGKMPGFDKALGADTCKQLVSYLRGIAKKK